MLQNRQSVWIALLAAGLILSGFLTGCVSKPSEYDYRITSRLAVDDPQFARTIGNLLGPPMVEGNTVTTLVNGDEIFPAMLEAILSAERSITFETFVYWQGAIGATFADAFCDRARAGVNVNVLIDAVGGTRIEQDYLKQMQDAGVHVALYHPLKWFDLGSVKKLNNRTHRKILVIDGRVGFTGGVGVADEWQGHAQSPVHWRDTHYRIEGPVVAQLQAAFLDNWMAVTGEVLTGEAYFPDLASSGEHLAQMFKSSSEGGSESMHLMYLLSLAGAKKSIRLATAYFVPDKLTIREFVAARERGVLVQIIVPGPVNDAEIVRKASKASWGTLLEAGVEIYEYQPTLYHCKLMIIDDLWTSIGSANFDNRSFRLNDEANLNVLDSEFAAEQVRMFEADRANSRRITLDEHRNRPLHERLMETLASLVKHQL